MKPNPDQVTTPPPAPQDAGEQAATVWTEGDFVSQPGMPVALIPRYALEALVKAWGVDTHLYVGNAEIGSSRPDYVELYTAAPATQDELAYIAACNLAKAIHAQHYREDSPNWRVLPDIRGVITQIDNMVAGLTRRGKETGK